MLNWIEFSAMAFGMSSLLTRVGIRAWYAGPPKAWASPETNDRQRMCHACHPSSRHEHSEQPRARHLYVLGAKEDLASLGTVSRHAADQREEEDGNTAEKLIQREIEGRMAQPINQPALRNDLHPGANAGHAGTEPHQPEISILKCFKYPAKS